MNTNNNSNGFSQQQNQSNNFTDDIKNKNESNSTINYIKSLQNKIKILNEENENLKKLYQQNNQTNYQNNNNKLLNELELYKNKILIMEQDKLKYAEKINEYEKEIIGLRKNNQMLNQLVEEKNQEIENIKNKFEIERNEFLDTMKSLREIIIQKENEKNIFNPFIKSWKETEKNIKEKSHFKIFNSLSIVSFIVKANDDLRQEVMTMQLIKKYDEIFKSENIPLKLHPYEIIITSNSSGLIEFIPDTISFDALKKNYWKII
jgi:phosphatidylinositol 4-kinase